MNQENLGRWVAVFAPPLLLAACAVSQERFYADRESLSDAQVCRAWVGSTGVFSQDVGQEAQRRGLLYANCEKQVANEKGAAVGAVVLGVLGAAAIYSAKHGGGGGGGGAAQASPSNGAIDYEWDWDQFMAPGDGLVWACRGVQTGQFADEWHCAGKPKADLRWPGW
jgi:hypothetical protein